jgi:phosphatidate cytidylyltransferase
MGHAYMIALVLFCQTLVYREVTALFSLKGQDMAAGSPGLPGGKESQGRDPWSKTLNWYFFATTNYFLYGESIIYYFKVSTCVYAASTELTGVQHVVFVDSHLTALANQHRFISFMLYMIGFVGFVASLKRGYLKQQFGLFCWVHMTLLLIVVSRLICLFLVCCACH